VPIVAIEPAVKPAAAATRTGAIGVLATTRTLASTKFRDLVARHAAGVAVVMQACPGLVEQVEKGELDTLETRALVAQYIQPLLNRNVDGIVLGCTHYTFLADVIRDVAGPAVTIIDPAVAVARELRRRLESQGLRAGDGTSGSEAFWTSGDADSVRRVMRALWRPDVQVKELPSAFASGEPAV
jgi:glutamate racemase